jgi:hypothetical protein
MKSFNARKNRNPPRKLAAVGREMGVSPLHKPLNLRIKLILQFVKIHTDEILIREILDEILPWFVDRIIAEK